MSLVSLLQAFALIAMTIGKELFIDMSYKYNNRTASPPDPTMWKFQLYNEHKGQWQGHGDIWFEINNFRMNEHAGTHVDAPAHFKQGGWDPSEIPLERLYNLPAVVIDISSRAAQDPHAQLLPEDLEAWESEHGEIPKFAAILVNSNWGYKWGTDGFMNIVRNENNSITDMRFPSVSPAAAQWIIDNRPMISCVGIDTTSLEWEPGYNYTTHRILLGHSIYGIENTANIHLLPAKGANISIMPIKIEGGSGAAARIIAVYDDKPNHASIVNGNFSACIAIISYILLSAI